MFCFSLQPFVTTTITSKKRSGLSLKRKLDILDVVENSKKSKRKLAEELGVPRSTLYDILKEKDKLKETKFWDCLAGFGKA